MFKQLFVCWRVGSELHELPTHEICPVLIERLYHSQRHLRMKYRWLYGVWLVWHDTQTGQGLLTVSDRFNCIHTLIVRTPGGFTRHQWLWRVLVTYQQSIEIHDLCCTLAQKSSGCAQAHADRFAKVFSATEKIREDFKLSGIVLIEREKASPGSTDASPNLTQTVCTTETGTSLYQPSTHGPVYKLCTSR